jgi:hypothetical protein
MISVTVSTKVRMYLRYFMKRWKSAARIRTGISPPVKDHAAGHAAALVRLITNDSEPAQAYMKTLLEHN